MAHARKKALEMEHFDAWIIQATTTGFGVMMFLSGEASRLLGADRRMRSVFKRGMCLLARSGSRMKFCCIFESP